MTIVKTHRRVAIVTGAARGIGLATSQALLAQGHQVVMVDRIEIDLQAIDGEKRSAAMTVVADIDEDAAARDLVTTVMQTVGPVGILVNNAGISPKLPDGRSSGILDVTQEEWARTFSINVTAVMRMCQLALPQMRSANWGRIVNLSSLAGRTNSRVAGPTYMATKAAVIGLTRAIASEMGPHGITANCVAPGRILTEMAMQAGEAVNAEYAANIPVRRLGTVEEVANAVAYLCGEQAGFVNGAIVDVNGGYFMP